MSTATIERMAAIRRELEQIRHRAGILRPADVVEFAENPATALHDEFTWDDSEAAHHYRLWQARQVIRVNVTILPECSDPVRVYVSLSTDRTEPGGGYRSLPEVLTEPARRAIMLADALAELRVIRRKYATLQELSGVFEAIEQAERDAEPPPAPPEEPTGPAPRKPPRNPRPQQLGTR